MSPLPRSWELFPNILGEAIISGVNILSTDVGDVKLMLPSKKNIVHNYDAIKFSQKIEEFAKNHNFNQSRNNILKKNSSAFHKKFSQNKMIFKYHKLWKTV